MARVRVELRTGLLSNSSMSTTRVYSPSFSKALPVSAMIARWSPPLLPGQPQQQVPKVLEQ